MAGINKVILVGRLGANPEVRHSQQENLKIVNFSVATSETWKDKLSGERKERTEWHRVVIFNPALSDIAEKYLRKGSQVYIEGQLQNRKWTDPQGIERHTTEVVLSRYRGELSMLDSRSDSANSGEFGNDNFSNNSLGNSSGGGKSFTDISSFANDEFGRSNDKSNHNALLNDDVPF